MSIIEHLWTGFWNMLDHWQALVAGEIAIGAAYLTVRALRQQARDDRERKSRAARALLPAALASMGDYTAATVWWLTDARLPAQIMEVDADTSKRVPPGHLPQPEISVFDILRECVEHSDPEPAQVIAGLLSKMQVHRSRLSALHDRLTNPRHYSAARVLLGAEIDQYIAHAVTLHAMCDRLFPFARMKTNAAPAPIDLDAVTAAFHECGLSEVKETGAWNKLTEPYMQRNVADSERG